MAKYWERKKKKKLSSQIFLFRDNFGENFKLKKYSLQPNFPQI